MFTNKLHKNSKASIIAALIILISIMFSFGIITVYGAPQSVGNYNVYYGMLHSHTSLSDGSGSPDQAYSYARDTAKLDFFSIADHNNYPNDMTAASYKQIIDAANSNNQAGSFTTLYGFEWTSEKAGHITVINADDFFLPSDSLNSVVGWLSSKDVVAFFNHPGEYGTTFENYSFNKSDKIVGMELWNRSEDYYSSGHYDKALKQGFYIGASGSQDNHEEDWGTANDYRLAVLSKQNTRADILEALKARRFFSTRDNSLALSFKMNSAEMGSKISGGTLKLEIQATGSQNVSKMELIKNGTVSKTWSTPNVSETITGAKGDYFYVIVYNSDSWSAISSPIFITDGVSNPAEQSLDVPTAIPSNSPTTILTKDKEDKQNEGDGELKKSDAATTDISPSSNRRMSVAGEPIVEESEVPSVQVDESILGSSKNEEDEQVDEGNESSGIGDQLTDLTNSFENSNMSSSSFGLKLVALLTALITALKFLSSSSDSNAGNSDSEEDNSENGTKGKKGKKSKKGKKQKKGKKKAKKDVEGSVDSENEETDESDSSEEEEEAEEEEQEEEEQEEEEQEEE